MTLRTTPRRPAGAGNGPDAGAAARRCPVPACGTPIGAARLMCRPHWYQVPKPVRDRIWATWRSGAGTASPAYRQAVTDAIRAVGLYPEGAPARDCH